MHLLITWLLLAVGLWLSALLLPGFKLRGFGSALVVAAIFGVFNWLVGWFLFVVIGIGTLGLGFLLAFVTRWIVDAIVLELTDVVSSRLQIRRFGWALAAALVMSAVNTAGEAALHSIRTPHAPPSRTYRL